MKNITLYFLLLLAWIAATPGVTAQVPEVIRSQKGPRSDPELHEVIFQSASGSLVIPEQLRGDQDLAAAESLAQIEHAIQKGIDRKSRPGAELPQG